MDKFHEVDKAASKEFGGLPEEGKTITLPAPSAMPGDSVSFFNYRCSNESTWGKVTCIEIYWSVFVGWQYVYTVKPVNKKYTLRLKSVELICQKEK